MRRPAAQAVTAALLVGLAAIGQPTPPAQATQTFGSTPLDDVLGASQAEAACGLTRDKLAAIVLAPTFPETGATPPTAAPSPMTLSRYDNQPSLHAFGNPDPAFMNAFFHPGVGAWQFDSAGGWGLSADAVINTFTASALAADVMARRYCTAAGDPSLTDAQRRAYAWLPWHGCNTGACESIYNDLFDGVRLRNLVRDATVGRLGGMEQRTCRLINEVTSFTCWYVDPARAQGHTAFRAPGFGPSPITAPFYVYSRNGREYRHWLVADTGYAAEVSASKPLPANARTSLTWSGTWMLCDLVTARGTCDPIPPSWKLVRFHQALGTYQPVVGDYSGDGLTDIIWYSASGGDAMWRAIGDAQFVGVGVSAAGVYSPFVGDFNGDDRDDIFWFSPTAGDAVWYGQPGGFSGVGVSASGAYTPLVGDYNGDGFDDVFWFSPTAGDAVWYGRPGGFTGVGVSASGAYTPLVGDYNGDGFDDVVWYSPVGGDAVWYGRPGGFTGVGVSAVGTYSPFVGDFNGDGFDDVFWYSAAAGDAIWYGRPGGFNGAGISAAGSYRPVVVDLDGSGQDDVIWYAPGSPGDAIWRGTPTGFVGQGIRIQGSYQPLVGRYDDTGGDDVVWYAGDITPDAVWHG